MLGGEPPVATKTLEFDADDDMGYLSTAFIKLAELEGQFVILTERPTIENSKAKFTYYVVGEESQPSAPYLGYEP